MSETLYHEAVTVRAEAPSRVTYAALGASLYVPATHLALSDILSGGRVAAARSLIVCTEDAVSARDLPWALNNLARALERTGPSRTLRFVRTRNADVLRWLVQCRGLEHLDGVVLPKMDADSLPECLRILEAWPEAAVMPTIETEIAFDPSELRRMRRVLDHASHVVPAIRIGGNDLLHCLGVRRSRTETAYETPLRGAINAVLGAFKPHGYEVSAPVFEHMGEPDTLRREVLKDVAWGLTSKTAVHPRQIPTIERLYAPELKDVEEARRILAADSPAVFASNGSMTEPATHSRWARSVLDREAVYGLRAASPAAP